ncbi:PP2C family protein-serine/threonine phosphatase [Pseudonocardia humida]|uniref:SpoIIE family protein phosphatase n=1 Tax=Pseudonocardia humida TaxID=2800819 RepID=A0ABT1A1W3_9PSEU|nr:GAF domain-containing SpoIIE family protein phosphatase [Pseudonocardia humida]MCO1656995.1 SpoIIE family protein phosphatase [Pseudonocardia humida]
MSRRRVDVDPRRMERVRPAARPEPPQPPAEPVTASARTVEHGLLAGAPLGAFACDERGVVRTANPAALRMLPDLTVGEVLGGALAVLAQADPTAGEVDLDVPGRAVTARPTALTRGWTGWYLQDVTESRTRLDNLLAERTRSRFLAAASTRLGQSLHPGRTARALVELAAELADSAVVVLPVQRGTVEWFRCDGRDTTGGRLPVTALPELVAAALRGTAAVPDPLLGTELAGEPWTPRDPPAGAVVCTLPGDGHPAGALVLVRDVTAAPWQGPDATLVEEFTERAGVALTAAALYAQRSLAAEVLRRTNHEPRLPRVDGITIAAAFRPAEEGLLIGSDFYDVHTTPDGAVALLIGEVRERDVDAAVTAGQVRQSVRVLRRLDTDPVHTLELLNTMQLEAVPADGGPRFVSLVLGDARALPDGGVRLRLAGGGHLAPLVVRRDGVEVVDIGGGVVGAHLPPRFVDRTVDLAPGEACVLHTDGVVDAQGGVDGAQLFGEQRLAELLRGCHILPAPGIVDRILDHTTRRLDERPHDDMALLVVQAPAVPTPGRRHLYVVRPEDASREEAPGSGRHRQR